MKVNLDKQFKNLSGLDFTGDENHMGKVLAQAIIMSNRSNSIKLYDWSLKLYNKVELEIDETDFTMLKEIIDSTDLLNVLCKAQLLKSLER